MWNTISVTWNKKWAYQTGWMTAFYVTIMIWYARTSSFVYFTHTNTHKHAHKRTHTLWYAIMSMCQQWEWIHYAVSITLIKFGQHIDLGSGSLRISMIKDMLVNKNFPTWHMIGFQHSHQPIRSDVRKSLLSNMEFNMDFPPVQSCNG